MEPIERHDDIISQHHKVSTYRRHEVEVIIEQKDTNIRHQHDDDSCPSALLVKFRPA